MNLIATTDAEKAEDDAAYKKVNVCKVSRNVEQIQSIGNGC